MSENMGYNCEIAESVQYIVCSLPEWDADASDRIFEAAGNWTIYTGKCHYVMRESRNEDAAFVHMGPDVLDGCQSFSDVVTKLAFWAVYQDLWDEYGRWSDEDKLEARDEDHCADCGEVFGLDDLECDREGREGDSICEGCHEDWLEDQDDDEEEVA
jgi:hypothetical protein